MWWFAMAFLPAAAVPTYALLGLSSLPRGRGRIASAGAPIIGRSRFKARAVFLRLGIAGIAICMSLLSAANECVAADLDLLSVPPDTIVPTDPSVSAAAAGRFAVNSDGAATYSYPIWVPKGRRDIESSVGINYNSRTGNGLLGVGWSLQGLSSITRCKRDMARDSGNAPITFTRSDAFCLDGQRLVAFPNVDTGVTGRYGAAGTEYRTEEDRFVRVINGPTDDKGPLSFEVRFKDGRIFFYGTTSDSRLEGQRFQSTPASLNGTTINKSLGQRVRLTWALAEVRERFGNNLTVEYSVTGDPANGQGYEQLPKAIRYTGTVDGSLPNARYSLLRPLFGTINEKFHDPSQTVR